jgi:hypothetical protein
MKTKSLILIAFVAIITLSFSFATTTREAKTTKANSASSSQVNEPIVGFISEDKF